MTATTLIIMESPDFSGRSRCVPLLLASVLLSASSNEIQNHLPLSISGEVGKDYEPQEIQC
jgi:hypothetical protein